MPTPLQETQEYLPNEIPDHSKSHSSLLLQKLQMLNETGVRKIDAGVGWVGSGSLYSMNFGFRVLGNTFLRFKE